MHDRLVAKRKQHVPDRPNQRVVIAAGQVGAPLCTGARDQTLKQLPSWFALLSNLQADAAGTVTGRVVRPHFTGSERDDLARLVIGVDRRRRLDAHAEHGTGLHRLIVEKDIVAVQIDRHIEGALRGRDAGDVIDVSVGEQYVADRQPLPIGKPEQAGTLDARIDEHRLARRFAADDEAVFQELSNSLPLNYHDQPMILAVLDDLMFTSKIKSAASRAGVTVTFVRSAEAALAEMRKTPPALVILDLNNARTDPLGLVGSMKQDAALASIPTVGYVSHVQTDLIDRARQAGVGEVLARSAFSERVADILTRS